MNEDAQRLNKPISDEELESMLTELVRRTYDLGELFLSTDLTINDRLLARHKHALRLTKAFASLTAALQRQRKRSITEQRITIEYVNQPRSRTGGHKNLRNNPMQSKFNMSPAKKCLAQTRNGKPCQSPAMTNGRCRMHGGTSSGAPKGNQNALKHGYYKADSIAERRIMRNLIREATGLINAISNY